jgi:hypothetical protein
LNHEKTKHKHSFQLLALPRVLCDVKIFNDTTSITTTHNTVQYTMINCVKILGMFLSFRFVMMLLLACVCSGVAVRVVRAAAVSFSEKFEFAALAFFLLACLLVCLDRVLSGFRFVSLTIHNYRAIIDRRTSPARNLSAKMFRESDAQQRHPHVTFKPKPDFQRMMEHSFDDSASPRRHTQLQHQPEEIIPTTWDSRYEPEHVDADYAGLVSKSHQARRHRHGDHSSQQCNIAHTDLGITGQDDFQLPRKRKENGGPFNPITGEPIQQQKGPLIAGPGDTRGTGHWKTSYQRMNEQEATSRDMLTLKRQQELVGGHGQAHSQGISPHLPPHLRAAAQAAAHATYSPTSPRPAAVSSSNSMSYEAHRLMTIDRGRQNIKNNYDADGGVTGAGGVARGGSMISSLGSSLVDRVPEFEANGEVSHAARRNKVLMVENFEKHYKQGGKR